MSRGFDATTPTHSILVKCTAELLRVTGVLILGMDCSSLFACSGLMVFTRDGEVSLVWLLNRKCDKIEVGSG